MLPAQSSEPGPATGPQLNEQRGVPAMYLGQSVSDDVAICVGLKPRCPWQYPSFGSELCA